MNKSIFNTSKEIEKEYLDINVYTATKQRLEYIFEEFDNICFSVSFGKDSSVLLQIALEVAPPDKLPLTVLFIDLEAQYAKTIQHAEELLLDKRIKAYWICLPINLRNAVSIYDPYWICWDETAKDKWVRPMPDYECVINIDNLPEQWDWFYSGMEFEEFVPKFGQFLSQNGKIKTASVVAIRADESLHRLKAVKKLSDDSMYKKINWTTIIRKNLINIYPLYDWRTEDIWTIIGLRNYTYNHIYDFMYLTGKSIHEMRICQPYGDDQRDGLDLFRKIEPETWFKVVERVAGANYGNIYCNLEILGNGIIKKHGDYTWKDYCNFLLNTIPKWQAHIYQERWNQFLLWWDNNHNFDRNNVLDEIPPKSDPIWIKPDGTLFKKLPAYERLAKTILKNDINCKTIGYGLVVGGYPRVQQLKERYGI